MISLGRYFGEKHYMRPIHPFSALVLQNKRKNGTTYCAFNSFLGAYMSRMISKYIAEYSKFDAVCSVPVKPGEDDRFAKIVDLVCENNSLENISENLICVKDYGTQKGLSATERERNISGAFEYNGDLHGKSVILIDDIVTTGSTLNECITVLKNKGAKEVLIAVFAINQRGIEYYSSNQPVVLCDCCGEKMVLRINGKTKEPFFACNQCIGETKSFSNEYNTLIKEINSELKDSN